MDKEGLLQGKLARDRRRTGQRPRPGAGLAAAGARDAADLRADSARDTADAIIAAGGQAWSLALDVTDARLRGRRRRRAAACRTDRRAGQQRRHP